MESNIISFDQAFDDAFSQALSGLKDRLARLSVETAAFSPQLAYLKHLSAVGLDELRYLPDCSNETESFVFSFQEKRIVLSNRFRHGWMDMIRGATLAEDSSGGRYEVLRDSLENFILHELFHRDQQLTAEQHEDYRSAPNIGKVIDYHADASAVLAAVLLHSEYDRNFEYMQWRALYVKFARSALRQVYAFVKMGRAGEGGDRHIAEDHDHGWRLNVFNRHLVWHYQYHRLRLFRSSAHVDQVQLLFEPGISLRFMHDIDWDGNHPPVNQTWPEHEEKAIVAARMRRIGVTADQFQQMQYRLNDRANLERCHLMLAAPNFWGIPKIYRFSPTASSPMVYRQLFEGIADGDTDKTKPFFSALFADPDCRQLTGHSWLPPGGPTGPGSPVEATSGQDNVLLDDNAPKLYGLAARYAEDFGDRRFLPARAKTSRISPDSAEMHREV